MRSMPLGGRRKPRESDVFEWLCRPHTETGRCHSSRICFCTTSVKASSQTLLKLGVAVRPTRFIACEPLRSRTGLAGASLLLLIGCNDVTRHDADISVHAGVRRSRDLGALAERGWMAPGRIAGRTVHPLLRRQARLTPRQGLGPALPKRHETRLKRRWTPCVARGGRECPAFGLSVDRGMQLRLGRIHRAVGSAIVVRARQSEAHLPSTRMPRPCSLAIHRRTESTRTGGGRPGAREASDRDRIVQAAENNVSLRCTAHGTEHHQRTRRQVPLERRDPRLPARHEEPRRRIQTHRFGEHHACVWQRRHIVCRRKTTTPSVQSRSRHAAALQPIWVAVQRGSG